VSANRSELFSHFGEPELPDVSIPVKGVPTGLGL